LGEVITQWSGAVIRTQIQLTPQQVDELKRAAAERGVSMAAVIREAIDQYVHHRARPSVEELKERAISAAGCAHSVTGDVSQRHDDYFADVGRDGE